MCSFQNLTVIAAKTQLFNNRYVSVISLTFQVNSRSVLEKQPSLLGGCCRWQNGACIMFWQKNTFGVTWFCSFHEISLQCTLSLFINVVDRKRTCTQVVYILKLLFGSLLISSLFLVIFPVPMPSAVSNEHSTKCYLHLPLLFNRHFCPSTVFIYATMPYFSFPKYIAQLLCHCLHNFAWQQYHEGWSQDLETIKIPS